MNSTPKKQVKTGSPSAAPNGPRISRRDFLKGAAVVAGASALAACTPAVAPTGAPATEVPQEWDKEVDVVVLGTGTASLAGIVAADAGSQVLFLEKAPVFGGHTAISGGGLWAPNNFVMQKKGIKDSREDALTYIRKVSEGRTPDELLVKFIDTCNEMIDYTVKNVGIDTYDSGTQFSDYYPDSWPGHSSNPRFITPKGSGAGLIKYMKDAIDARASKIEVLLETRGLRLLYDGDSNAGTGQVIGVVAQAATSGKEMLIKARKGVVIGTGGFDHDKEMSNHFLRAPIYYTCSAPTNTGDGHRMCMAVGAMMRNMNECWGLVAYNVKDDLTGVPDWSLERGKPGTIIVNKHGERIGNEAAAYEIFGRAFSAYDTGAVEWRNIPSYAIFDSGYATHYALPGSGYKVGVVPDFFKQADTLEALAGQLGINVDALMATVTRFNENARNGLDPDWHRGENSFESNTSGDHERTDIKNPNLAPVETGPFYGTAIWPGTLGTNGGPRTTVNGEVLNVWGKAIPRLYVTGNTMASVFGGQYPGGGATLGPGFTFSYIEGKHVATLKPWDAA